MFECVVRVRYMYKQIAIKRLKTIPMKPKIQHKQIVYLSFGDQINGNLFIDCIQYKR